MELKPLREISDEHIPVLLGMIFTDGYEIARIFRYPESPLFSGTVIHAIVNGRANRVIVKSGWLGVYFCSVAVSSSGGYQMVPEALYQGMERYGYRVFT